MTLFGIFVLLVEAVGVLLLLVSAIGIVRLPDVHRRMQAASVGASVGITLVLLGAGLYFVGEAQIARMVLLIIFFFVTAPIATTAMARAAYRTEYHNVQKHLQHDDMAADAYTTDYEGRAQ
jgi:multicomponent Na+:H+ antiporter subunit G